MCTHCGNRWATTTVRLRNGRALEACRACAAALATLGAETLSGWRARAALRQLPGKVLGLP